MLSDIIYKLVFLQFSCNIYVTPRSDEKVEGPIVWSPLSKTLGLQKGTFFVHKRMDLSFPNVQQCSFRHFVLAYILKSACAYSRFET